MTPFGYVMTTYVAALVFGLMAFVHPAPRLIWNASASVPIGLYAVQPAGALHLTELVVIRPPDPLASFLADRGYLPKGVPLLKRVLALPGQTVCRRNHTITVDGIAMGGALERDRHGRALPVWQGCRTVPAGEVFLMNRHSGDSLDSRYFGSLPIAGIIGKAEPLWTEQEE